MSTAERVPIKPVTPAERQERWARVAGAIIFIACAAITWDGARSMSGSMIMPGGWSMSMMWMTMPGQTVWGAAWMFLLMWNAMMIAMMLPSSWPMLTLYRRVAVSSGEKHPALATALVGGGYFAIWMAFGVVVFTIGLGVSTVAMQSRSASLAVPLTAGALLIFAGTYQISPWKQSCLAHCRSTRMYLGEAFRPGLAGAARLGVVHGSHCVLCCWALMIIQMVFGVMNLSVMIAVAAVIGLEKLWTRGPLLARLVGAAAIGAGLYMLYRGV